MHARTAVLILIAGGWLSSGCAHIGTPGRIPPGPQARWWLERVVGRWDAVMSVRPGTLVRVLAGGGTVHVGRLTDAGVDSLRLHAYGSEFDVAIDEVERVDVVVDAARRGRRILGSAVSTALATGAAVMILERLLDGSWSAPPAGLWAIGAAAGAWSGAVDVLKAGRWRTIYLSPAALPVRYP